MNAIRWVRRSAAAAAALTLTAAALTACSTGGASGPIPVRVQISSPAIEAQEYFAQSIEEYNAAQDVYEASVEYVPYDQLRQTLLKGAASGTLPDVVLATSLSSSIEVLGLGGWADMSEYMTDEWKTEHRFLPGVFDELGGYGVPVFKVNDGIVYYDKHAFEEAGIEAPAVDEAWTWDEFTQVAETLTANGRAGFAERAKGGFIIMKSAIPYFFSYGTDIIEEKDGAWRSAFESEPAQEALRTFVELFTVDQVKPVSSIGWGLNEAVNAWNNQETAMLNIGDWFASNIEGEFGVDWDAMLFPVAPGVDPVTEASEVYFHVTQTSQNKDGAWDVINWALDDDRLATWAHLDNLSVPTTEGALEHEVWVDEAFLLERVAQWSENGRYLNQHPQYTAIWETIVGPVLQDAAQGNITIDQAIERLNTEINAALGV